VPGAPIPKGPLEVKSLEEYRKEHPFDVKTLSPEVQKSFSTDLDPAQQAILEQQKRNAQADYMTAKGQGDGAGQSKALADYNTILAKEIEMRETARDKGRAALQAASTAWDTNLATSYNKAQEQKQATAGTIEVEDAKDRIAARRKILDGLDTTSTAAHDGLTSLQTVRELSDAAGQPGFLTAMPDVSAALVRIGALKPEEVNQLSAQDALTSASNRLITSLRSGTGFQRTTNMDLQFLDKSGPGGPWTPQEYRNARLAFLISAYQHQGQYTDAVRTRIADGMQIGQAQKEADAEVGPVIQQIPKVDPKTGIALTTPELRTQWGRDNLTQGGYFKDQSGRLGIFNPPSGGP
jgi:hypothetical protein